MSPSDVRVSVVMPAFNVEKYIRAALDSLLRQTFSAFEVIVVDDRSSDGTAAIVASYSDRRILLVRHAHNQGPTVARNTGLQHARGEFIALLDADDIAVPTRLEEQVAALDADQALGMVGAYVAVMNERGQLTGQIWRRPLAPQDVAIGMLFRNTIFTSMAFRKTAAPDGFFRQLPVAEDYDFNVRIASRTKIMNLARPLTHYRVRGGGLTHTKAQMMERCVRVVMREQLRELGLEPTARELDLNRHVGALTLPNSPHLLQEIEQWLLKLREVNAKTSRHPEAAFERILAMEWFEVCKFASSLGTHAFAAWRTSSLAAAWQPSPGQKLKFATKCLLRHTRTGGDVVLSV